MSKLKTLKIHPCMIKSPGSKGLIGIGIEVFDFSKRKSEICSEETETFFTL
jgi:hypothetical protein